jgi:hypothetical protein
MTGKLTKFAAKKLHLVVEIATTKSETTTIIALSDNKLTKLAAKKITFGG